MLIVFSLIFTLFSRLGYLNIFGVAIVFSESMKPFLRKGDMVLYIDSDIYSVGDVVMYCRTISFCIVHRVVDIVSYDKNILITKGDANSYPDPPISKNMVKGKVVFYIPREIWVPLTIFFIVSMFIEMIKAGAIGYSYATTSAVVLIYVVAVYTLIPQPVTHEFIKPPTMYLRSIEFDVEKCVVVIRYGGEFVVTNIDAWVNGSKASVFVVGEKNVEIYPFLDFVREAFEKDKILQVYVNASLNQVGLMVGDYSVKVGGYDPDIKIVNNSLFIENNNCFPLSINISIVISTDSGWKYLNQSIVVYGFEKRIIELPLNSSYVYVYWMKWGDMRWIGLPTKIR